MLSDVQWLRPLATVQEAPEKPVQERPLPPQTPLVPKGDFKGGPKGSAMTSMTYHIEDVEPRHAIAGLELMVYVCIYISCITC